MASFRCFAALAIATVCLAAIGVGSEAGADYFGRSGAAPSSSGDESGGGSGNWPLAGLVAWLSQLQTAMNAMLMGYLRDVRAGGLASAGPVIGAGFVYGVVHAAGPGHGKVVVAGYFLGTPARMATGIAFSFFMALVQALVAIALVVVFALIVGTSLGRVAGQVAVLEPLSYAIVAGIGAVMMWRAVRGRPACAHCAAHAADPHGHEHLHGHDQAHGHRHDHGHLSPIGRVLALLPYDLRVLAVGVGLRPCTGAILLLLFTLAGGVFWVGILAVIAMAIGVGLTVSAAAILAGWARSGLVRGTGLGGSSVATARVVRIVEFVGAGLVLAIGTMMMIGTVATGGLLR
ncbi:hypothetical protein [Fodinicurvata sp. EGI_FJ10296]|uniref:nickel/cobalt transporter n=1 Tax=Fodinicurvata sp. EGI_FJ10296 TaxID=3231908 RepID=UPI0034565C74